jgi:hypothetical protein
MVEAPNPLGVHPTSISYVYKVFQHLDMLWMGICVHPYVAVLGEADEGAIEPLELPPMVRFGWEGVDRAGGEGRAELGNGIAAPVVAGKGAIDPAEFPPMQWCGWQGETDIAR